MVTIQDIPPAFAIGQLQEQKTILLKSSDKYRYGKREKVMTGNKTTLGKQITLRINRKETQIPLENIVYAQVTDKLCTIYLYGENTPPVRIFLTINALMDMLPGDTFIKVSRSCLISLDYYQHMNDSEILLAGDVRIPYSRSNRSAIRSEIQKYMEMNAVGPANPEVRNRILDEFHGFDHFPLPFCIVENIPRGRNMLHDFVFRYVNDAFAAYTLLPAYQLVNASFFSLFEHAEPDRMQVLSQCSLQNQRTDSYLPGIKGNSEVRAFCYQPYFSFCACLLTEIKVIGKTEI